MTTLRRLPLLGVTALALVLSACSSDSALNSTSRSMDFRHDDPPGFLACRDLGLALGTDDEDERAELIGRVAAEAASAQSPGIRGSVTQPPEGEDGENVSPGDIGEYTVVEADLQTACEEVGFDFAMVGTGPVDTEGS